MLAKGAAKENLGLPVEEEVWISLKAQDLSDALLRHSLSFSAYSRRFDDLLKAARVRQVHLWFRQERLSLPAVSCVIDGRRLPIRVKMRWHSNRIARWAV
jgi:hypothetical protein